MSDHYIPHPFENYGAGGIWPRNSDQAALLRLIAKMKEKQGKPTA